MNDYEKIKQFLAIMGIDLEEHKVNDFEYIISDEWVKENEDKIRLDYHSYYDVNIVITFNSDMTLKRFRIDSGP